MALRIPTATRDALAQQVQVLADAGSGPAVLEIRSGTQPATGNDTATGTLLATVTLGDPSFGTASTGTISAADPAAVNPTTNGTAGWFRVKDSTGASVYDGAVTATGGGGELELSNTTLVATPTPVPVDITALTVTMPAS